LSAAVLPQAAYDGAFQLSADKSQVPSAGADVVAGLGPDQLKLAALAAFPPRSRAAVVIPQRKVRLITLRRSNVLVEVTEAAETKREGDVDFAEGSYISAYLSDF
jgi:hypothetical protein